MKKKINKFNVRDGIIVVIVIIDNGSCGIRELTVPFNIIEL